MPQDYTPQPNQTASYPTIALDPSLPFLTARDAQTHKGSYGTLLLVCGSYGMIGAAAMAAKAALRCGVGLVNVATRKSCYPLLAPLLPEAVFTVLEDAEVDAFASYPLDTCDHAFPDQTTTMSLPTGTHQSANYLSPCNPSHAKLLSALEKASACVIGCGLGADAACYLPTVFAAARCPLVVDADALNFLAQHPAYLETTFAPLLFTPHPAEMARLCACTTQAVQENRAQIATAFSEKHHAITILKGASTVVANPDGSAHINPTGNAGMAKGGSGDVLAGMLGAFLAQGIAPNLAAEAAVYIHGTVGDLCAEKFSQTAMQPTDMIKLLPSYFKSLQIATNTK